VTISEQKTQLEFDKARAELKKQEAEALARLGNQNIDITPLLNKFGLKPLGNQNSIELRAYHLEYGILTLNEARARIGLPSVPNGDKLLQPTPDAAKPAPTQQQSTKSSSDKDHDTAFQAHVKRARKLMEDHGFTREDLQGWVIDQSDTTEPHS
jgi:hypothetical protein